MDHLRTRIKICGLINEEAVKACTQAGADAVGFVFYPPSVRNIEPAAAAALARGLGAWQTPVALFVNAQPQLVHQVVQGMPNVLLQFHGDETPDYCESFARPYIKAIRMRGGVDLAQESARYASAQALLVDSWSESYGGSGHTFDWSLLPGQGALKQALVLSGGLDHANVAQAIAAIRPYGVDVSSGVESTRGVKDLNRIFEFCKAVHRADATRAAT
ncbi:phosphoribosylanthranilate isomerase [Limnobacter sp.]|uniref:phosphoribosylanthranilate isomerase n=1 Tax=Limnobacter sp. TaxID=2003368 RepID=UPI003515EE81